VNVRIAVVGWQYHVTGQLPRSVEVLDGATVDVALTALRAAMPDGRELSPHAMLAVAGRHIGTVELHDACRLREGDEMMVIVPVAGG
jgi:molybdopterin converting factor small subunit